MMRWWMLVTIGFVGYLLFVVANLPAQQALHWLGDTTLPVTASGVSGTIWSGKARQSRYLQFDLGAVSWQFNPLSLLQGKFQYQLEFRKPGEQLTGRAAIKLGGRYQLMGINGLVGVEQISRLIGQPYIEAVGKLEINLQRLEFTKGQLYETEGIVRWLDAGIRNPIKAQLGSLQFTLSGNETGLQTMVKDLGGPIKVDGEINLTADNQYRVVGKVKPTDSTDSGLANTLRSIGRPAADGTIQINYSGQL